MDTNEVRGSKREKGLSRSEVLEFRMGYSNAATGHELKECLLSFFETLPKDFVEAPTQEDEKRFRVDDVVIREPFDALSKMISDQIKAYKQELAVESKADERDKYPLKTSKRKRLIEFSNKPHMVFARRVQVPSWKNLTRAFAPLNKSRTLHRVVKCKRDVNLISPRMRNWKLEKIQSQLGFKQVAKNALVYHVSLFKSYNCMDCFTKDQEILILGHQYLADLKDSFYCIQDKNLIGPSLKNCFIHIEDTIYDDVRHPDPDKLSATILDWIKNEYRHLHRGLCRYTQRNMAETRILDLSVRLGSHYSYVHQGNCLHTVVFEQIRMLSPDDIQNEMAYPWKKFQQIYRRQKCGVCDIFPSKWVTYGDRLATQNPFFFCNKCYYKLHYDKDGELLSTDYRVFDYVHS